MNPYGRSELQDSSQEPILSSKVTMTLMTEGKTLEGGGRRLKREEVWRSQTGCPQGLGKSGRKAAFFLVIYIAEYAVILFNKQGQKKTHSGRQKNQVKVE